MRGSIYYQTSLLSKAVFRDGAKKKSRIDITDPNYKCLASYNSMDTYRKIWNNFGEYLREVFDIKDFEKVEERHVIEYMKEKILSQISHLYLKKLSSALGKLEFALNRIAAALKREKQYDFSKRIALVKEAKEKQLTANNYRDRAYNNPQALINLLCTLEFKIAANIQLHGGARSEGVSLIKKEQLKGFEKDETSNALVGIIETKEKGGKKGEVLLDYATYIQLSMITEEKGIFKINYAAYCTSIRNACRILNMKSEGTHGFRWNFAQRRLHEYLEYGVGYTGSLHLVSLEMKHFRSDITNHYTGK